MDEPVPAIWPARGRAVVALGGNVPFGDLFGPALLESALDRLAASGLPAIAVSSFRTTRAWPDPSDPPFTNAVAVLSAGHAQAQDVLAILLKVEVEFGRVRGAKNAPRTLDLDLLDLDGQTLDLPGLTLPHPRLAERAFVLEPLADIWPDWLHPVLKRSARSLLHALRGGKSG